METHGVFISNIPSIESQHNRTKVIQWYGRFGCFDSIAHPCSGSATVLNDQQ